MLLAALRDTTQRRDCVQTEPPQDMGGHVGHFEPDPTDPLALDRVDEKLLHAVARTGPITAPSLASALGLDEADAASRVRRLLATGWLAASDSDLVWMPHPEIAMGTHVKARQQQVDRLRSTMLRVCEDYRRARAETSIVQLVEIVTGTAAIRTLLESLQARATHEVAWFCKAGHVALPAADNDAELASLRKGVTHRVVYERALLEEDGMLDSVRLGVALGEQARAVDSLPVRLAIFDRTLAVCPLVTGSVPGSGASVAVIHDSLLVRALDALFATYWDAAVPLDPALRPDGDGTERGSAHLFPLNSTDRDLMALVVTAMPDKAIASHLGLSTRTVRRRIASILERTGCSSRIQLAWKAARGNWLDTHDDALDHESSLYA